MIDKENLLDDTFLLSTTAAELSSNVGVDVATHAYFKGGHWGQCLELLQHLCQYSENIVLVLGDVGLGKSTLKQALITTTGEVFKYFSLEAEDYHQVDTLLREIAAGFGVGQYITQVSLAANLATASARDDKVWVLLLDNAHLLSDEVLQALINLFALANTVKTQGKSRLRLVLFGQLGLEQKLEAAKLQTERQENSHVLELEPLTTSEVEAYLQYKWRAMGNKTALPFDSSTVKRIAELSAGNPRMIERLARDQMAGVKLTLPKKGKHTKGWSLPKIPVAALMQGMLVIVGLAGLAIFLLKPMLINSTTSQLVKIEMPVLKSVPSQLANRPVADEHLVVAEDAEAELPKSVADILQAQTASPTSAAADKPEEVLPRVIELEKLAQQKLEQLAKQEQSIDVALPAQAEATSTQIADDTPNISANGTKQENPGSALSQAKPKLLIVAPSATEKTAALTNAQANKTTEDLPTNASITPAQTAQVNYKNKFSSGKSAIMAGSRDAQQQEKILSMPSGNFTLQLLGAAQISGIEQFIRSNKLENQAYYYRSVRQNQPWYILLYGNYPTRTQAKAAVTRLPAAVRALNPWVRDIAGVKKALPKPK